MIRPRMNALLYNAIQRPLVIVCAPTGYGKTRAVSDFLREGALDCAWIQASQRDNLAPRLWETLTHRRPLTVIDDFHLIVDPVALAFLDRFIHDAPEDRSLILITRENPRVDLSDLRARGLVSELQEDELKFTDHELASYLQQQGIPVEPRVRYEISRDTDGWALAIDLIARCLKRAPGYRGYAQSAMKRTVFELMESEAFDPASEQLFRDFLRSKTRVC
ncbi:MAG: hypothetical protein FWC48_04510 [Actinomycetia bacterium]|nr:hypothetical protein [Actinomycetes bacterium]